MSATDLEQALRQTLSDRRLSRGEQQALSHVLESVSPSQTQLGAFRTLAFQLARSAATNDIAPVGVFDWLEDVIKVLTPVSSQGVHSDASFSPGEDCRRRICGQFRHARRSADVCVFTITDNEITEAIVAAHRRGVRVRIITDDLKASDRGSDIDVLQQCGIEIRLDRTPHHMHHKFAIFDGGSLLSGSYNWTVSAMRHNEENLIVTDDAALIGRFAEVFESLWRQFA